MRRAIRISRDDVEGYNFFTKALVDAGYVEISQTEYIEIEFVKPDPVIITPPPKPPDPAKSPWWESLTVTIPRTKIYADVPSPSRPDGKAQVYYSVISNTGEESAPEFDQKALLSSGQPWVLPLGKDVEVWRAPLKLSGWICVAVLANRTLWVRGEDMRITP